MLRDLFFKYKLDAAWKFLTKHRFSIAFVALIIWLAFFDRITFMNQYSLHRAKNRLESEQEYFLSQIEESKRLNKEIHGNLEKFAREKYYMHKKDEDVFVFK